MPTLPIKQPLSLKNPLPLLTSPSSTFNPTLAGRAIVDSLKYLQQRLEWSGAKIAKTLHLPANTVTTWLSNGSIPIHSPVLHPDIQAIIHLLAIHRSLEAMFNDPAHQRMWLATSHPELNAIPEKLMSESLEGLIFVRQYLDYARGKGA